MSMEIKAGSVVQMKSGSIPMTVSWVREDRAYCEYFNTDTKKVEGYRLPITSLVIIPDE